MRKTFRNKNSQICIVLSSIICVLFLTACSNKKVDYDMDGSEGNGIGLSGDSSIEQFQDVPRWKENLDLEKSNGQMVPVLIDTSAILPDTDGMDVVEIQKVTMDAAYKEQFAKALFGDSQIYGTEIADFTGLSDDYSQVTDYEENCYKGNIDGGTYCLIFTSDDIFLTDNDSEITRWYSDRSYYFPDCNGANFYGENNMIYLYAADDSIRPQHIAPGAAYRQGFLDTNYPIEISKEEKEASNLCTLTEEEAKARVESFLDKMGFSDTVYLKCEDAYWQEYKPNEDEYERDVIQTVKDGYVFTYQQEWESYVYDGEIQLNEEREITRINISINDTGILRVLIVNPFNTISITEDVGLLSFETIQEIIRKDLSKNADDYYYWWNEDDGPQYYQKLELRQYCLQDDSDKDRFRYIPVWKLSHLRYEVPNVVVNAMDGTILSAMSEGAHVEEEE